MTRRTRRSRTRESLAGSFGEALQWTREDAQGQPGPKSPTLESQEEQGQEESSRTSADNTKQDHEASQTTNFNTIRGKFTKTSHERRHSRSSVGSDNASTSGPADLLEEIEISPWTRWARYGVWPTRLLIHSCCVLSLICYVFWIEEGLLRSSVNYKRNAYNLLFRGALQHDEFSRHGGFDLDAEDFHANDFVLFNTSESRGQIERVLKNYFRLEGDSVDNIIIAGSLSTPSLPFPSLEFHLKNGSRSTHIVQNAKDLGPLRGSQSRERISQFIHELEALRLEMWLESINPDPGLFLSEPCIRWLFVVAFSREKGSGPFYGHLRSEGGHRCSSNDFIDSHNATNSLTWLHAWLCVATFVHLGMGLSRVARGIGVLRMLRTALTAPTMREAAEALGSRGVTGIDDACADPNHERLPHWSEVTFRDKLTILNFWNILAILGDLACLLYVSLQFIDVSEESRDQGTIVDKLGFGLGSEADKVLLGLGCAFHLLSLLEYSEYGLVSYLFLQVHRAARLEVLKLLFGFFPVTMAYIVYGVAMYGEDVSRFGSLRNTAITLFSLSLGDELTPTFRDLEACVGVPRAASYFYVFSFIALHLNIVGMCVIAVVREAFVEQGLWLLNTSSQAGGHESTNLEVPTSPTPLRQFSEMDFGEALNSSIRRPLQTSFSLPENPRQMTSIDSTESSSFKRGFGSGSGQQRLAASPGSSIRQNTGISLNMSNRTAAAMQRTKVGRSSSSITTASSLS